MKKTFRWMSMVLAMVMLISSFTFAVAAEQADNIVLGKETVVNIKEVGYREVFYFTPETAGTYVIWSYDSDIDTYVYWYMSDALNDYMTNDDGGAENNFKLIVELEAGHQYKIEVASYADSDCGTMKVKLDKEVDPKQLIAFDGNKSIKMSIGEEIGFDPIFLPMNSREVEVTYTNSNPKVAEFDGDYLFALSAGKTTITAQTETGLKDSIAVEVEKPLEWKLNQKVEHSIFNKTTPSYFFTAPADGIYYVCIDNDDVNVNTFPKDPEQECQIEYHYFDGSMRVEIVAKKGQVFYIRYTNYSPEVVSAVLQKGVAGKIVSMYPTYETFVGEYLYPEIKPEPMNAIVEFGEFEYTFSKDGIIVYDEDEGEFISQKVGTTTVTAKDEFGNKFTFNVKVVKNKTAVLGVNKLSFKDGQYIQAYDFTPTEDGMYYLYGNSYSWMEDELGDYHYEYDMKAGQTYTIYVENNTYTRDDIKAFSILKEGHPCLLNKHKFRYYRGLAATTETFSYVQEYCDECGITNNGGADKLKEKKPAEKQFTDVKKKDWFYKAVNFAFNSNLFNGTSTTKFSPNSNMTRGMFVTVLGRLSGVAVDKKATSDFVDVAKGQYYTTYVSWANDSGIVNGVSKTKFAPDDNITREQICVMMVRYFDWFGEIGLRTDTPAIKFKDEAKFSSWAKDAIIACQKGGIVNGIKSGDGYVFNPQGNATRAEVATILYNYMNNYIIPILNMNQPA